MKETKGHVHCPVNGWDCPYYNANGICMMYPDTDPINECDDFAFFWDENDDYICYDDHTNDEPCSDYFDNCDYEIGFDPYIGCFTDDC